MIAILILLAAQAAAPAPPTPPPPPACAAKEYHQFDYWVGDWNVTPAGSDKQVAKSKIESLYGGCAIRENWMPSSNPGGGSLSAYDASDKRWHQRWIDNSGTTVDFDGGLVGGKMVLTGFWKGLNGPGQDGYIRMTYTKNADGSVRQFGEQSLDHGVTWTTSFDFLYRPTKAK